MMMNLFYDYFVTSIPLYVQRLFTNFSHSVQTMEIDMFAINTARTKKGFGYSAMKHLFFTDCGTKKESIRLPLFLQLFDRSLETILIYRRANGVLKPSIRFNAAFAASLLSACSMIAEDPRLKRSFQSIIVLNPKDPISGFIEYQQAVFKKKGWRLEHKAYAHHQRGLCPDALHVTLR